MEVVVAIEDDDTKVHKESRKAHHRREISEHFE